MVHDSKGYVVVYQPNHPRANHRGYVKAARLVGEALLGRALHADEVVHHINRNKADDRPENIQVLSKSDHDDLHYPDRASPFALPPGIMIGDDNYRFLSNNSQTKRACPVCGNIRWVYVSVIRDPHFTGKCHDCYNRTRYQVSG